MRQHLPLAKWPDPGLQVSEHLRSVVDKARQNRQLPPSSKLNSPTLQGVAFTDEFQFFADNGLGAFEPPNFSDPVFGTDFQWNQGWDFSLADQLFSTVTEPRGDGVGPGLAFWDRTSGI